MRLNRFNDLPPRPEFTERVRAVLRKKGSATVIALVTTTGLSRTQVLSSLEALLASDEVERDSGTTMTFRWKAAASGKVNP